jgi:hypothetical protein
MRRFALALLTATALAQQNGPPPAGNEPARQIGKEAAEKTKQAVVMISAATEGDVRPGAGIIFGLANDRVYIATANSLLRRGTSNATDIEVSFRWSHGEHFKAELLTYYDASLDLAVIAVPGLAKTGAAGAVLSLDRIGNPSSLAQGVRGDPVWEIGYSNYAAYSVSAGQVSQVEAVVLKYRVPAPVRGGYSGGPVLDRNGLIVAIVRQDQPPNNEATRIDLVLSQLKVWGYPIDVQSPSAAHGISAFQETLRLYVAAAPSGFVSLGARSSIGGWEPNVKLPNASCRGHGISEGAHLECVLVTEENEVYADQALDEAISAVEAALPGWNGKRMNGALWSALNGPTPAQSTVSVSVRYTRVDAGYDVTVSVYRLDDK